MQLVCRGLSIAFLVVRETGFSRFVFCIVSRRMAVLVQNIAGSLFHGFFFRLAKKYYAKYKKCVEVIWSSFHIRVIFLRSDCEMSVKRDKCAAGFMKRMFKPVAGFEIKLFKLRILI